MSKIFINAVHSDILVGFDIRQLELSIASCTNSINNLRAVIESYPDHVDLKRDLTDYVTIRSKFQRALDTLLNEAVPADAILSLDDITKNSSK